MAFSGVTIGIFPDEREQLFLDHFDEWMKQYELWKVVKGDDEEEKKEEETEQSEEKERKGIY